MGNVGSSIFGAQPILGTKSQAIWATAASILTIPFLNLSLASPQLCESVILNCWNTPSIFLTVFCFD